MVTGRRDLFHVMSIFRHSMSVSLKVRNLTLSNKTFEINSVDLVHKVSSGIIIAKTSVLLRYSTTYVFKTIITIPRIHCVNKRVFFAFFEQEHISVSLHFTCPPENGTPIKNSSFCFLEWQNLAIFFWAAVAGPRPNLRIIVKMIMVMNTLSFISCRAQGTFFLSCPHPPHTSFLTRPISSRSSKTGEGRVAGAERRSFSSSYRSFHLSLIRFNRELIMYSSFDPSFFINYPEISTGLQGVNIPFPSLATRVKKF